MGLQPCFWMAAAWDILSQFFLFFNGIFVESLKSGNAKTKHFDEKFACFQTMKPQIHEMKQGNSDMKWQNIEIANWSA